MFLRLLLGEILLIILVLFFYRGPLRLTTLLKDSFIVAIFNSAIPFLLSTYATKSLPSSVTSMMAGFTPLATYAIAYLWHYPNIIFNFMHLSTAFIGLFAMLLINWSGLLFLTHPIPLIVMLLSSVSYGVAAIYINRFNKTDSVLLLACTSTLFSLLIVLLMQWSLKGTINITIPQDKPLFFIIFWLGLVSSGIASMIYCRLINNLGSFTASTVTYLMVLTGVIYGVCFFHDSFTMKSFLGCTLLFIALTLQKTYL